MILMCQFLLFYRDYGHKSAYNQPSETIVSANMFLIFSYNVKETSKNTETVLRFHFSKNRNSGSKRSIIGVRGFAVSFSRPDNSVTHPRRWGRVVEEMVTRPHYT